MSIITGYMPHTATLSQSSGLDARNRPITVDINFPCRYEPSTELIKDASGREIMSEAIVLAEIEIKLQDSITFDGKKYPVKRVDKTYELDGTFSHYEVYL